MRKIRQIMQKSFMMMFKVPMKLMRFMLTFNIQLQLMMFTLTFNVQIKLLKPTFVTKQKKFRLIISLLLHPDPTNIRYKTIQKLLNAIFIVLHNIKLVRDAQKPFQKEFFIQSAPNFQYWPAFKIVIAIATSCLRQLGE